MVALVEAMVLQGCVVQCMFTVYITPMSGVLAAAAAAVVVAQDLRRDAILEQEDKVAAAAVAVVVAQLSPASTPHMMIQR